MTTIIVEKQHQKKRIDKFLSDYFQDHSRSYFQYLLDNDCVHINGKKIKKKTLIEEGDEISVYFLASEEISLQPEEIPLNILFEDEHILIISKPRGMVVHPGCGNYTSTFVHALLHHCKNLCVQDDPLRPGIVHRLDKDTSGVLIAAKTTMAHQKLIEQFSQREVQKSYLAICFGKVEDGTYSFPIGRHKTHRKMMAVTREGKEAITTIKTLAYRDSFSLLQLFPKTGRTHQLRVHLHHLKAPILGDPVYGSEKINKKYSIFQQLLHAWTLKLCHPIKQIPLQWTAPIPKDIQSFISQLFGVIKK